MRGKERQRAKEEGKDEMKNIATTVRALREQEGERERGKEVRVSV